MNLNYDRRIMHNISRDYELCAERHVAPYLERVKMERLIREHKVQCDHRAVRLNPHGLDHTGDSGSIH